MRRVTWLAAGFGLGAAVAHRATRGGTQPVLVTAATGLAIRVRDGIGVAIAEGRAEMRQHEVRIREAFGTDTFEVTSDKGAERTKR